ncbi:MAG: hypothetical protein JWM98_525, partial [Thermoleophilia bacterium]|nr:hypothetical protein [Thermoleophilia bacterium]
MARATRTAMLGVSNQIVRDGRTSLEEHCVNSPDTTNRGNQRRVDFDILAPLVGVGIVVAVVAVVMAFAANQSDGAPAAAPAATPAPSAEAPAPAKLKADFAMKPFDPATRPV